MDFYTGDSTEYAEASIRQHLDAGIPRRKLVVGAAIYGRAFTGVNPQNNGLYQPYERFASVYPYSTLARRVYK